MRPSALLGLRLLLPGLLLSRLLLLSWLGLLDLLNVLRGLSGSGLPCLRLLLLSLLGRDGLRVRGYRLRLLLLLHLPLRSWRSLLRIVITAPDQDERARADSTPAKPSQQRSARHLHEHAASLARATLPHVIGAGMFGSCDVCARINAIDALLPHEDKPV